MCFLVSRLCSICVLDDPSSPRPPWLFPLLLRDTSGILPAWHGCGSQRRRDSSLSGTPCSCRAHSYCIEDSFPTSFRKRTSCLGTKVDLHRSGTSDTANRQTTLAPSGTPYDRMTWQRNWANHSEPYLRVSSTLQPSSSLFHSHSDIGHNRYRIPHIDCSCCSIQASSSYYFTLHVDKNTEWGNFLSRHLVRMEYSISSYSWTTHFCFHG